MTSTKENTKDLPEFQLKTDSDNLLAEILQIGLQRLMELERNHHIDAGPLLGHPMVTLPEPHLGQRAG